jgi:ATP-dependent phosphofructokinase / diphosphate-dependent phosphofructokinase
MGASRIGILTGGGDCPGLNAVIRGVAKSAMLKHGMEVVGFYDGFLGLIERRFEHLTLGNVSGILTQGGTILGTSNKGDPFNHVDRRNGETAPVDVSDSCVELYHELGLEALVCLGGDGTMSIGGKFSEKGLNIVGVPKTIDKDVACTDETFGFDSARAMATDAIDRLHTTASAHQRVMFVEVMGRNAGWLALESCIAGGGDIVLIPEIPYRIEAIISAVEERHRLGKRFSIVVVSEGAAPVGGSQTYYRQTDDAVKSSRLGGCSRVIADQIESATGIESRYAILGHLQRGGTPTPYDRLLATRFAVQAVAMVINGEFNRMVTLCGGEMGSVPIADVVGKQRKVSLDSSLLKVAQEVGTSFGVF